MPRHAAHPTSKPPTQNHIRRARFGGEEEEVEYGYDEAGDAPPDAAGGLGLGTAGGGAAAAMARGGNAPIAAAWAPPPPLPPTSRAGTHGIQPAAALITQLTAGPHSPLDVEMTTADYQTPAGDAAAAAVLAAARSGRRGSAAMMDALEAAEAAFDDAEGRRGAAGGSLGVGSGAGAGYEDAAAAPPPPDTPRKAAICEATRERIIQKVFEALQANPRYALPRCGALHCGALRCACCVVHAVLCMLQLQVMQLTPPLQAAPWHQPTLLLWSMREPPPTSTSPAFLLPPPPARPQVQRRARPRLPVPRAVDRGRHFCALALQAGAAAASSRALRRRQQEGQDAGKEQQQLQQCAASPLRMPNAPIAFPQNKHPRRCT